jgi:hypothetical protein
MPAPPTAKVHPPRVATVRFAHRQPKTVFRRRHGDPMPVVGHPAIRPNLHPALLAPLGQQLHIGPVSLLAEKRRLAAVAALGHLLRHSRQDHPCQSRHAVTLTKRFVAFKNYV